MYSATVILFKHVDNWDNEPVEKKPTVNVPTESKKDKEAIEKAVISDNKSRNRRMGDLRQYYIGSFNVVLNDLEMQYLEKHVEHLVRKIGIRRTSRRS